MRQRVNKAKERNNMAMPLPLLQLELQGTATHAAYCGLQSYGGWRGPEKMKQTAGGNG